MGSVHQLAYLFDESAIDDEMMTWPVEFQCEFCEAEANILHAHSVGAVSPGVRGRFDTAKDGKKFLGVPGDKRDNKMKETLQEIKNRTLCSVCGESGHWHTDPACKQYEATMKKKDAERRAPKAGASARGPASPSRRRRSRMQPTMCTFVFLCQLSRSLLHRNSRARSPLVSSGSWIIFVGLQRSLKV